MKKTWYVHRWYRGRWFDARPFPTFDQADKLLAAVRKAYAKFGWRYEIHDSPVEHPARMWESIR